MPGPWVWTQIVVQRAVPEWSCQPDGALVDFREASQHGAQQLHPPAAVTALAVAMLRAEKPSWGRVRCAKVLVRAVTVLYDDPWGPVSLSQMALSCRGRSVAGRDPHVAAREPGEPATHLEPLGILSAWHSRACLRGPWDRASDT